MAAPRARVHEGSRLLRMSAANSTTDTLTPAAASAAVRGAGPDDSGYHEVRDEAQDTDHCLLAADKVWAGRSEASVMSTEQGPEMQAPWRERERSSILVPTIRGADEPATMLSHARLMLIGPGAARSALGTLHLARSPPAGKFEYSDARTCVREEPARRHSNPVAQVAAGSHTVKATMSGTEPLRSIVGCICEADTAIAAMHVTATRAQSALIC
ncbi:hypothetical protein V8C86DRAFT_2494574 [Haematococcus lacustris]